MQRLSLSEPSAGVAKEEVSALTEAIAHASCPEEAARLGRRAQRCQPHLIRPDWDTAKLAVMQAALHAKVSDSSNVISRQFDLSSIGNTAHCALAAGQHAKPAFETAL